MSIEFEKARARILVDPVLVERTWAEIQALAAEERRTHPAQDYWREADAALASAKTSLSRLTGGERLLEVERLRVVFGDRLATARAAASIEAERTRRCAVANSAALRNGGAMPNPVAALADAARSLRNGLDAILPEMARAASDPDRFDGAMHLLDDAVHAFRDAMMIEKRAARLRRSAIRAVAAIDSFAAAA